MNILQKPFFHGGVGLVAFLLASGIAVLQPTPIIAQATSQPDVIVFTNGDQLTGKLERGVGTSLIFKSDELGEVKVSLGKVKELRTNGTFAVLQKGEKITRTSKVPGTITYADKEITVTEPGGAAPEVVPTSDLAYIIDSETYNKEVTANPTPLQGWTGAITGGATIVRATDYGENFNLGIGLIRAIPTVPFLPPRTRSTVDVLETYGKLTSPVIPQTAPPSPAAETKTSIFHADAEHDKYFSTRLYALAAVSFDHNYAQGLSLQSIYGGGLGYTVFNTAVQQLDLKADVHYERQNFFAPTPGENLIGSIFGEAYHRNLPRKIVFTENATFIPAWNNSSAYSAIFAAGLVLPTYKRLSVNLNVLDNYLNNPAAGYDKNSFQFITGVSYSFK